MRDYDRDPAAIDWARKRVQRVVDKYAAFEQQAADRGDMVMSVQWRKVKNILLMDLLGFPSGCVIAAFDDRRPSLPDLRGEW